MAPKGSCHEYTQRHRSCAYVANKLVCSSKIQWGWKITRGADSAAIKQPQLYTPLQDRVNIKSGDNNLHEIMRDKSWDIPMQFTKNINKEMHRQTASYCFQLW